MKSSLRGSSIVVTGLAFAAFALLVPNCQPSGGDQGGSGGSNESGGSGGSSGGSGGNNNGGSGGNSGGSGGNSGGSGGNSGGSGGNSGGSGGNSGGSGGNSSGGSSAKGGSGGSNGGSGGSNGGSGGSNGGSGGSAGSGGSNNGGTTSSGGSTTPTGGTTTSGTKNSGTTVTFEKGKAAGAMTGYGWVALGSLDSISDPTCGASKTPITSTTPCAADPNWSGTGLCLTGSAPALGATPDYTNNYGVVVGVNAGDKAGTGDPSMVLGQAFTTITVAATGLPTSEVRIQIHKLGDPDGTSYCIKYSSSAIDLTKFATDCYATAPTGLFKAADIPNIDKVSLEAVSAATAVAVTSMCITGITFAK